MLLTDAPLTILVRWYIQCRGQTYIQVSDIPQCLYAWQHVDVLGGCDTEQTATFSHLFTGGL